MSLDVTPSPAPKDKDPSKSEPGFSLEDWNNAVILRSDEKPQPVVPPEGHALCRFFARVVESTVQGDFGLALPLEVEDRLTHICIKTWRVDALFPPAKDKTPPFLVLLREFEEGPKVSDRPVTLHDRRQFYGNIGDRAVAGLSLFPGLFRIGLRRCSVDTNRECKSIGRHAYREASNLPDEPYSKSADMFRQLSEEFDVCVAILKLVHEKMITRRLAG